MIRVIFTVLLALLALPVLGVDHQTLMEKGNQAYEAGEYPQAIIQYEKILASGLHSADLYYNLGCAYFSEEAYGLAILNFEKAHQLNPRDADIRHNLEYSKLFIKDRFDLPEPMPLVAWFISVRNALSINELRTIELVLFAFLVSSLIWTLLQRRAGGGSAPMGLLIISAVLFLAGAGWLLDRSFAMEEKEVIILNEEVAVKSAPLKGSNTLFVIHEGSSGEILDATDEWYEIRLPDGKTGWITHEVAATY